MTTKTMLTINDLDWKGQYAFPPGGLATAGGPGTLNYSSGALAVRYVNGERRFLTVNYRYSSPTFCGMFGDLVEYKVPAVPPSTDKISTSTPLLVETRRWKDWTLCDQTPGWTGVVNSLRVGGLVWDEAQGVLWYQLYGWYSSANMPFLAATQLLDTPTTGNYREVGTKHGPWWYRDKAATKLDWKTVDYWVIPTPPSAIAEMGGKEFIAGATVGSIGGACHNGPGFHAIDKPPLTDAPGTIIPLGKRLADYSPESPFGANQWDNRLKAAHRNTNYQTMMTQGGLYAPVGGTGYWPMSLDQINSFIWIDTPTKEGIILFGRQCSGYIWYGFNPWETSTFCQVTNPPATCAIHAQDPTRPVGAANGYGATEWHGALYAFNPEHIRQVALGNVSPWADKTNPDNLGDWKVKWPNLPTCQSGRFTESNISNGGFWDAQAQEIIWLQPSVFNNARPSIQFFKVIEEPTGDTMPPTITIDEPLTNTVVEGIVAVKGKAADDVMLAKVEVSIDAQALEVPAGTTDWTYTFDSTTHVNGPHEITAIATDTSGNKGETSITLDVQNDTTPPVFEPVNTVTVLSMSGSASDLSGIDKITASLDGGAEEIISVGSETFTYLIDTSLLADGDHTVVFKATDLKGNESETSTTFTTPINGDTSELQKKIDEFIVHADKAQMQLAAANEELDHIE